MAIIKDEKREKLIDKIMEAFPADKDATSKRLQYSAVIYKTNDEELDTLSRMIDTFGAKFLLSSVNKLQGNKIVKKKKKAFKNRK